MIVAAENDVGAGFVQHAPYFAHDRIAPVAAGTESRDVPVGEDAVGLVRVQILLQPFHLRRAFARGRGAVQRDDVPGAEVVAVVAEAGRSGILAEIGEVGTAFVGDEIVVSDRRTRPFLVPSPCRFVAVGEVLGRTGLVGVISGGEHGTRN